MANVSYGVEPPAASDNIGDVLASIRRLIAQDESGRIDPATRLRQAAVTAAEARRGAPESPPAASQPLILGAAEKLARAPQPVAQMPRMRAQELPAQAAHGPVSLAGDPTTTPPAPKAAPVGTAARPSTPPEARGPVKRARDQAEDISAHLFTMHEDDSPADHLLRTLIREAIRHELQGELGGQFSRNLRRVIRSEVELALHAQRSG